MWNNIWRKFELTVFFFVCYLNIWFEKLIYFYSILIKSSSKVNKIVVVVFTNKFCFNNMLSIKRWTSLPRRQHVERRGRASNILIPMPLCHYLQVSGEKEIYTGTLQIKWKSFLWKDNWILLYLYFSDY